MFVLQYLQIWNACITFFAQPYLVNKFSCKEAHGFTTLSMVNNYKCNEPFLQQHFVKLYLIIDSLKLSILLSTMLKIKQKKLLFKFKMYSHRSSQPSSGLHLNKLVHSKKYLYKKSHTSYCIQIIILKQKGNIYNGNWGLSGVQFGL